MLIDGTSELELISITAEPETAGRRLDVFLAAAIPDLSRSRIKNLIISGQVMVGGAKIVEPKRAVKPGDEITIEVPPSVPPSQAAESIPLTVIYEDDDLVVIDKPAGLVVHPGAGNHTGTLVNALIAHCGDSLSGIGGVARPGIVHRLDKDTSGLLVVAKNDRVHLGLSAQFADHGRTGALVRAYQAFIWGAPDRHTGVVNAPLARSTRNRQKMAIVRTGGRRAVTHFTVEETYGPADAPLAARLECQLETGRTHQIRVHLASLGHPLIGDRSYGAGFLTKANILPEPAKTAVNGFLRQALHAWLLGFTHPVTGEDMVFKRPIPADMATLEDALGKLIKSS
jgi:23S rRNA pseudouridine1911/1915/1917 synthase